VTVQAAPRSVLCVIDGWHRDLAVAEHARAGRYDHTGVALDLGNRPDWVTGGLAHDEEWRIEWVKLYEGLDLAHAYAVTGQADFLTTWEDLVESFCDQVPVGHDSSDVSARRVQNWLYAWARFAEAPGFRGLRPGLAEVLTARISADATHIAGHLTAERNHRTLELYTLLLVALTLDIDNLDTGGCSAEAALDLLADNAAVDVWDDGVHRECSSDYHLIVLRSLVGAVANARRAGLPVPAPLVDAAQRASDVALHLQRPDGLTPALSDGDQGDYRELLALAATVLDRPDLAWAATGGRSGRPPRQTAVSFPTGGYHVQRSGWGEGTRAYGDERFAVLDCGPIGDGGHGHYDQLSVELAGGGRPLVVDPGRYTYAEDTEGWRQHFKGTAAHNTVTVDGLDQTPYRRGKPRGPVSTARLLERSTEPGLDVIRGEVRSPVYDAVHTRTLALVDDDYWLVHDSLRAATPHRYQARWHLTPEATDRTSVEYGTDHVTVTAPGVVLAVPRWCGDVTLECGWVSPSYGVKLSAPVVVVTVTGRTDADIVTAVVPGTARVEVHASCDGSVAVDLTRHGVGRDHVTWTPELCRPRWSRRPW
jgi:Heparinase II/III-like protein/Heparinase II/III N-terminus